MKKIDLSIEEVLKYRRTMRIEVPEEMTEDELNEVLDDAQRKADGASDLPYIFERANKGIKVVKSPDSDMSSPRDVEVEIDNYDFLD